VTDGVANPVQQSNMGPVNFILESKASALGINTTVISKTANDKKTSMREQVCNLFPNVSVWQFSN
jgi:hypothetical protein